MDESLRLDLSAPGPAMEAEFAESFLQSETPTRSPAMHAAHQSELYNRFSARLLSYARRLADPALAEDIVQEVFLRVLKYKGDQADTLPLQFLITMTKNVALRMLASRRREIGTGIEDLDRPVPTRVEEGLVREAVPGLLGRLSDRQREAVMLTTGRGLSEHQASLAMNSSRSAVSQRRRQAIEEMRRVGFGRLDVIDNKPAYRG